MEGKTIVVKSIDISKLMTVRGAIKIGALMGVAHFAKESILFIENKIMVKACMSLEKDLEKLDKSLERMKEARK